jgi:hypothetical protein
MPVLFLMEYLGLGSTVQQFTVQVLHVCAVTTLHISL